MVPDVGLKIMESLGSNAVKETAGCEEMHTLFQGVKKFIVAIVAGFSSGCPQKGFSGFA